ATFTTGSNHGLSVGQTVVVSGVQAAGFNQSWVVATIPASNQFTVANFSSTANSAPGAIGITSATYNSGSGLLTVTTSGSHSYTVGESVSITGWSGGADSGTLNGTHTIASTPSATTFTYTVAPGLTAGSNTGGSATVATPGLTSATGAADTITAALESGN